MRVQVLAPRCLVRIVDANHDDPERREPAGPCREERYQPDDDMPGIMEPTNAVRTDDRKLSCGESWQPDVE